MSHKFLPNMKLIETIVFVALNLSIGTMKIYLPSPTVLNVGSYGSYRTAK